MSFLELKIPPPVVAFAVALGIWLFARHVPAATIDIPASELLSGILALCGALCDLSGFLAFRKVQTTINPFQPGKTSAVVRHGIYLYTRNPMYAGLLLMLSAWSILQANLLGFALLPLFVTYLTRFQIIPEERILLAKFGVEYADYLESVRRWI